MPAEHFLDTNVFIYHLEGIHTEKGHVANELIRNGLASGAACVSFQVVQECLNTALRKSEIPLDLESMRRYLDTILSPLMQVPATVALYHRALDLQSRYRYGFYDAMIVGAALEAGCRRLLSEDLQHGQEIAGLRIENPFSGC